MTKSKLTFVAAVLAVLTAVLAPKVSADQYTDAVQGTIDTVNSPIRMLGQNLCDSHRGTGDAMEASWCNGVVVDPYGRVEGFNPNSVRGQRARGFRADEMRRSRYYQQRRGNRYPYGYGGYYGGGYDDYGYGYGNGPELNGRNVGAVLGGVAGGIATRNTQSGWVKAGGILGGAVLGGIIGNKVDNRNERRTYESSRRESEDVSTEAHSPEPPPAPQTAPAPATRQQVERKTEQSNQVYVQNNMLCNDTNTAISVYVDGNPVGRLSAGQVVALSSLPQGKVQYFPIN